MERRGDKECQLTFDIPIASSSRTADAEAEHKGFKSAHSDTPRASNAKENSSNFCIEARVEDLGWGEGDEREQRQVAVSTAIRSSATGEAHAAE